MALLVAQGERNETEGEGQAGDYSDVRPAAARQGWSLSEMRSLVEEGIDEPPPSALPAQGRPRSAGAEDDVGPPQAEIAVPPVAVALPVVSLTPLAEIVAAHGWPTFTAFAVVDCESGWNPLAVSWAGARGLFQLMPVHAWRFTRRGWSYWTDAFVPARNVAIAYEIYMDQGWAPWNDFGCP